jgi:putative ABC transport system permease protein
MGTMSINVLERTREIGILRAIGASNQGVNYVFMIEGIGIGLLSCLISIPASFPITELFASAMGSLMTGSPWNATFTYSGVLIWFVIVIILSLLANYFPARNAARLTVREVLAYE